MVEEHAWGAEAEGGRRGAEWKVPAWESRVERQLPRGGLRLLAIGTLAFSGLSFVEVSSDAAGLAYDQSAAGVVLRLAMMAAGPFAILSWTVLGRRLNHHPQQILLGAWTGLLNAALTWYAVYVLFWTTPPASIAGFPCPVAPVGQPISMLLWPAVGAVTCGFARSGDSRSRNAGFVLLAIEAVVVYFSIPPCYAQ